MEFACRIFLRCRGLWLSGRLFCIDFMRHIFTASPPPSQPSSSGPDHVRDQTPSTARSLFSISNVRESVQQTNSIGAMAFAIVPRIGHRLLVADVIIERGTGGEAPGLQEVTCQSSGSSWPASFGRNRGGGPELRRRMSEDRLSALARVVRSCGAPRGPHWLVGRGGGCSYCGLVHRQAGRQTSVKGCARSSRPASCANVYPGDAGATAAGKGAIAIAVRSVARRSSGIVGARCCHPSVPPWRAAVSCPALLWRFPSPFTRPWRRSSPRRGSGATSPR